MGRVDRIKIVVSTLVFLFALSGCVLTADPETISIADSSQSTVSITDDLPRVTDEFVLSWSGEEISCQTAEEKGFVFSDGSKTANIQSWADFQSSIAKGNPASVTICTGMCINSLFYFKNNRTCEMSFAVYKKGLEDDNLEEISYLYSSAQIEKLSGEKGTDYYIGDFLVLSVEDEESEAVEIPFEYAVYSADSGANISFPYSKRFSSYSDFEKYFDKYNDELELAELNEDISQYNKDGGFNAHVLFLYGDMEGSDSVVYSVTNAVKNGDTLKIHLKKYFPLEKNKCVGKCQTVVKIPSEHLDDVNPEKIEWVVFGEYEN